MKELKLKAENALKRSRCYYLMMTPGAVWHEIHGGGKSSTFRWLAVMRGHVRFQNRTFLQCPLDLQRVSVTLSMIGGTDFTVRTFIHFPFSDFHYSIHLCTNLMKWYFSRSWSVLKTLLSTLRYKSRREFGMIWSGLVKGDCYFWKKPHLTKLSVIKEVRG